MCAYLYVGFHTAGGIHDMARDEAGKWLKGTSGNPGGRPRGESEYLTLTIQTVREDGRWVEVVQRAMTDAVDGDRFARAWLGNYLMGLPVQQVEVEHTDASMTMDEWLERAAGRVGDVE